MRLVKEEGTHASEVAEKAFPRKLFGRLIRALIMSSEADGAREEFTEKFVEEFDDVRFYTFASIA
jgi:U3 small nucleolar RNA-associated protein 19